jgi:hypothetical protein
MWANRTTFLVRCAVANPTGSRRTPSNNTQCPARLAFFSIAGFATLLRFFDTSSHRQDALASLWQSTPMAAKQHQNKPKQTEANRSKLNLKEIKMNSVNSKIEFFSIALIAVAFAAAQVTAVVSILV